jgi:hypothetical protein
VPTAVVVTTRDTLVSPRRQMALASAIEGATVHPVDADHDAAVFAADRFVPALLDACASVASRASSAGERGGNPAGRTSPRDCGDEQPA